MLNLLRCRRGTLAFATVIAAVPLIGMVAVGAEAGSWYVTKQHAQNAADAAAYSGALRLACTVGSQSGVTCVDAQTVDYRGKQFAAQSGFCNAGDKATPGCPITLPTSTQQSVVITPLTSWNGITGNFVEAQVSQTQPAYLAAILGVTTVSPGAIAVAQITVLTKPCVLALGGSISFSDSAVNVQAPGCGFASNDTGVGIDFKANPTVNVGSLATMGTCSGSTLCNTAFTYASPIPNPLASLNTAMTIPSNLTISNTCSTKLAPLTPYTASTPCVNDKFSANSATPITTSGVYFFSGAVKLTGSGTIQTAPGVSATIILLPGASLSMVGGTSINITAQSSVPTSELPSALQTSAGLLTGVAVVDLESGTPKTNGNASLSANGILYFPNADLDFQGNPTTTVCGELIANSIVFSGDPHFSDTGCPAGTPVPISQVVTLVQ